MGRRALRRIDPALDLSRHLKSLSDLPQPWDGALLLGSAAPLEVEVGSGKGLFLTSAAEAMPEHNFLGIEIAAKYARFSAARLAKRKLVNAICVHADAQRVFHEVLPDASLTAVHVYFPDPWWKKRHQKRRVMNERFVREIERTLSPGGMLHYWTDVEDRFASTLDLIVQQTRLAGPFEVAEQPAAHDLDYRTHFERRMRLSARPIHRAEFRRQ
jgi:tRNA (guanine-N7-)-methyltransferase